MSMGSIFMFNSEVLSLQLNLIQTQLNWTQTPIDIEIRSIIER